MIEISQKNYNHSIAICVDSIEADNICGILQSWTFGYLTGMTKNVTGLVKSFKTSGEVFPKKNEQMNIVADSSNGSLLVPTMWFVVIRFNLHSLPDFSASWCFRVWKAWILCSLFSVVFQNIKNYVSVVKIKLVRLLWLSAVSSKQLSAQTFLSETSTLIIFLKIVQTLCQARIDKNVRLLIMNYVLLFIIDAAWRQNLFSIGWVRIFLHH